MNLVSLPLEILLNIIIISNLNLIKTNYYLNNIYNKNKEYIFKKKFINRFQIII